MNKDGETASRKPAAAQHGGSFFVESHDGNRAGLRSRERNHPPRLPTNVPGFQEKNAISAAMPPSAAPESRKSRKSRDLRPICHVTISCDYRE